VPTSLLASFFGVLEAFRLGLTAPSFANLLVLACGWILTEGSHAVTESLVLTGVAGRRHHEAFHRFFSRGTWDPDLLGHWMFERLSPFLGDGAIPIVLDDTLAPKKGPHVFGIGSHLDAVRSTRRHRVFCFGHCWVVLAVLVRVPFSTRTWALPVLFRLYRNLKECTKHEAAYAKKTELARQMLDVFVSWVPGRRVELAADSAYCNDTVTRGLSEAIVLFGAMRPDAVLTKAPDPRLAGSPGRPSKRGAPVPKPEALARDGRRPWKTCTVNTYGSTKTLHYKTVCAQWYRACGIRLLRIVIVATEQGTVPIRVFFCTDATVDVVRLVETYAGRWGIEVFFRDAKQHLGFADSSARSEAAVRRVAPFVGLLYTALVVWFLEGARISPLATPPVRPWYTHKRGLAFADILRTARRAMVGFDILDPRNETKHLPKLRGRSSPTGEARSSRAA
jgi:DDE superfamily endonuclease